MVIVPYLALAPAIVTGAIALGLYSLQGFNKVENSLQYLVRSWPIIVELYQYKEDYLNLKVN